MSEDQEAAPTKQYRTTPAHRAQAKRYYQRHRAKIIAKQTARNKKTRPQKQHTGVSVKDERPEIGVYSEYNSASEWQETRARSAPIVHDPRLLAPPRIAIEPIKPTLLGMLKIKAVSLFKTEAEPERGTLVDTKLSE